MSRSARCERRQAADGFTLLEVLVALAVIALWATAFRKGEYGVEVGVGDLRYPPA